METTRTHKKVEGGLRGPERRAYYRALLDQLRALEILFEDGAFETGKWRLGAEQEIFLVDRGFNPSASALQLLERLDDTRCYTTELGLFNLEMNADPQDFTGKGFSKLEDQLRKLYDDARAAGEDIGVLPILTGILPTLEKSDLGLENMVPSERYQALNRVMLEARGKAFDFSIRGLDDLTLEHDSVMVEACNASFQVHLQLAEPERFAHYYNLSQLLLGPVLAAGTNSPVLFGRRLWAETRIALFEQSCDIRTAGLLQRDAPGRVSFGSDWLEGGLVDVLRENIRRFRPLVGAELNDVDGTAALAAGQVPDLKALRLHNGTIYRWNRPCYGISSNGQPHLRIELRVLPAGPTVVDEVASAAFWLGLMRELGEQLEDIPRRMNHDDARVNLYNAARDGLRARLTWLDGQEVLAQPFILEELLPKAGAGLARAGVAQEDADRYLGVLEERVRGLRTGSAWAWQSLAQMRRHRSPGKRYRALTAAMFSQQKARAPVAQWPLATLEDDRFTEAAYEHVSQLMVTDLDTVGPDDPIELVSELIAWTRVRYVPVEDDHGRLVGIVSYRSVLRHLSGALKPDGHDAPYEVPVSEIMKRDLITVTANTPTREAVRIMMEARIGSLPVVEGPHIVGMITEEEVVQVASQAIDAADRPSAADGAPPTSPASLSP